MPHVLVVDDEPGQREMLRLLLEDAGYAVEEASSGEAGLALLRATPERCVVLLDQRMPGLGGDGVLAIVAADPRLAARHAYILLTASPQKLRATPPTVLHGLSVPLVEKPFDVDALLAVVAAAAARLASA
jgi:CheY-like chemotaxis protein